MHKEMADRVVQAIGLAEPPIAIYYANEKPEGAFSWDCQGEHFCFVGSLSVARQGTPVAVDGQNPGCAGAAYYLGWNDELRPGFEYFLSHDSEGRGERFKKTPELVREFVKARRFVAASGRYCIFRRLADLADQVTPEVITIFGDPDDMSGLLTLANYGRASNYEVIAPMSSGCGTIVGEPRAQAREPQPKAVLGLFDPTVRPRVEKNYLTFSAPYGMFVEMVENIPGSFLEIEPWLKVRNRRSSQASTKS